MERLQKLREQIEDMNNRIQKAQREYDLNEAAKLQYGELPMLQKQLAAEEEKVKIRIYPWFTRALQMKKLPELFLAGLAFRWQSLRKESEAKS